MRNRLKTTVLVVLGGTMLAVPASAHAAFFGADLDRNVQPSNAPENGDASIFQCRIEIGI